MDWVSEWLRGSEEQRRIQKKESEDITMTPYKRVAKRSLMQYENLTEEEARREVETLSFEKIEGRVYATDSMNSAINFLIERLKLQPEQAKKLNEIVYEGINDENQDIAEIIRARIVSLPAIVIDTLFKVHDNWTANPSTEKKFHSRERKHQHLPSEFIGWAEVKKDLLFVKPIYEALGLNVKEEELKKEYIYRLKEYFLNNKIFDEEDFVKLVAKGDEFYPSLKGQNSILDSLKDEKFVRDVLLPQVEENGIGNIYIIGENVLYTISKTVHKKDLERLSSDKLEHIREMIQDEMDEIEETEGGQNAKYVAAQIRLHKVNKYLELAKERELFTKKKEDIN